MGFVGRIVISCVMAGAFGLALSEAGITSKDTPRRFWAWSIGLNIAVQFGLFLVSWR